MKMHTSTILIVDDEQYGREVLAALLKPQGYNLLFASSGAQAIAMALAHLPDLMLLDIMMPGMNGYTVCERLRQHPTTLAMPILMITALDDRDSRLRGLAVGADDFLVKPFDREELRARVRTITRLNRYRLLLDERQHAAEQARAMAQEITRAYNATIAGWAHALDLRDNETEGHSQRVTDMTVRLADELGIPTEQLNHIQRGALLHDIGKLGIPDAILLKPGPLDDDEWDIMRRHPVYAYEWLADIDFLRPALNIPYYHHERWDGSGYPQGLARTDIPLEARIFAVVDVWDALRSHRPYRMAWNERKVREYLLQQAGISFDPAIVRVFLHLLETSDPVFNAALNGSTAPSEAAALTHKS